jgi:hypothetical protein
MHWKNQAWQTPLQTTSTQIPVKLTAHYMVKFLHFEVQQSSFSRAAITRKGTTRSFVQHPTTTLSYNHHQEEDSQIARFWSAQVLNYHHSFLNHARHVSTLATQRHFVTPQQCTLLPPLLLHTVQHSKETQQSHCDSMQHSNAAAQQCSTVMHHGSAAQQCNTT